MAAADSPNHPEGADEGQVGRRVLLRGISAMGLAAFATPALAACGSDDEPVGAVGPDATPEPITTTTPAATPKPAKTPKAEKSPSAEPSASAAATESPEASPKATPKPEKTPAAGGKLVKASDTPLGPTSSVPVNSGFLFESDEYIVTQPSAGKFVGFDSYCTHEGCIVDIFDRPGIMACGCHSTDFKITDGSVISGPARKPMPKKLIIVENGQIYRAKQA